MDASASAIDKPSDVEMAEDICITLEQTILKYFPPTANEADRPRQASVPLVPPREEKPAA